MRQWIYDTTVYSKQRVKLVGRADSFCLSIECKTSGISKEIERSFVSQDLKFIKFLLRNHFGVNFPRIEPRIFQGYHRTQKLNLVNGHRFARLQVSDDFPNFNCHSNTCKD